MQFQNSLYQHCSDLAVLLTEQPSFFRIVTLGSLSHFVLMLQLMAADTREILEYLHTSKRLLDLLLHCTSVGLKALIRAMCNNSKKQKKHVSTMANSVEFQASFPQVTNLGTSQAFLDLRRKPHTLFLWSWTRYWE